MSEPASETDGEAAIFQIYIKKERKLMVDRELIRAGLGEIKAESIITGGLLINVLTEKSVANWRARRAAKKKK